MINRAFRYLDKLGNKNILFSGISGSVSYSPSEDDDIDIFLITRANRLWSTLIRAFIVRLINGDSKICISLTMDSTFARSYFTSDNSYLVASDAVHVIPHSGSQFYLDLLSESPFISRYYPAFRTGISDSGTEEKETRSGFLNIAGFIFLSSWLLLKSMLHNHRYQKLGMKASMFSTILTFHCFYLDSVKYNAYRQLGPEGYPEET